MSSRAALCAVRGVRRMLNTSAPVRAVNESVPVGYKNLKPIQENFCLEDQFVHVKGGTGDQLMYKGTMLVSLGALAFNGFLYFKLSFNQ